MIKTLQVKNFNCLKDNIFEFSKINLLTGKNGIGKSDVLRILQGTKNIDFSKRISDLCIPELMIDDKTKQYIKNIHIKIIFNNNEYVSYNIQYNKQMYCTDYKKQFITTFGLQSTNLSKHPLLKNLQNHPLFSEINKSNNYNFDKLLLNQLINMNIHDNKLVIKLLSLDSNNLILLDKPEEGLHPKAQVLIGRLIALKSKNNNQFIIETHSEHIINAIRVSVKKGIIENTDVHTFDFDNDNEGNLSITKLDLDSDGKYLHYPKHFMDQWNNQLMYLI